MTGPRITAARTKPERGQAVRARLRDCVEYLWREDTRVKQVYKLYTQRNFNRDGSSTTFRIFERPLLPIRLPDGTLPFVFEPLLNNWHGGFRNFDGLRDPRLQPLWQECLDLRPAKVTLMVRTRLPESLKGITLNVGWHGPKDGPGCTAAVYYSFDDANIAADCLSRWLGALGFENYARPEDIDPESISSASPSPLGKTRLGQFVMHGLPADSDLPGRIAYAMDRLGWSEPGVTEEIGFVVFERDEAYDAFRERINALAVGWSSEISGYYRDGFDPFFSPPYPMVGDEYRYEVAAYRRRNKETSKDTVLQVDVVHAPEGTYLEFLTVEGEKRIRHYAESAGLDFEIWKGELASRWG